MFCTILKVSTSCALLFETTSWKREGEEREREREREGGREGGRGGRERSHFLLLLCPKLFCNSFAFATCVRHVDQASGILPC